MNQVTKMLLPITAILIVAGYIVAGVILPKYMVNSGTCNKMSVVIKDQDERQYVTQEELSALIQKHGIYPVGRAMTDVQTDSIEGIIQGHPMIRTAECYETFGKQVVITVTQRIPKLKISTGQEVYYIDTDRKRMPARASITTDVMSVSGHVGERMAKNELYRFVEWIEDDSYWRERIDKIEVITPKNVVLKQKDGPKIILGDLKGYEEKLNRLQKWYLKGDAIMQWEAQYTELDIRYEGQVVGRKS